MDSELPDGMTVRASVMGTSYTVYVYTDHHGASADITVTPGYVSVDTKSQGGYVGVEFPVAMLQFLVERAEVGHSGP